MPSLLLLAALSWAKAPAASGCPWAGKERPIVSAHSGTVTVNGKDYDVDRPDTQTVFTLVLHDCNADSAIEPFQKWKRHDAKAISLLFFVYIPLAKTWRNTFVQELNATTPPRR